MTDPQRGLPHVPDRWSLEAVVTASKANTACSTCPHPSTTTAASAGRSQRARRITYRQLNYWARTALVEPTLRRAHGSGSQRLYSFRDVVALSLVKRLLDTGVSLANVRTALGTLRAHDPQPRRHHPAGRRITVYLCTADHQIIDLVHGGQAVFGLALGQVWTDVPRPPSPTYPPKPAPR